MYRSGDCQGSDGVFAITDLSAEFVSFRRENEGMGRVCEYSITGNRKGRLKLGRAHNRWTSGEDPSELLAVEELKWNRNKRRGGDLK